MPQLVVTCHPNGSVETLLKDKTLDTRMFGDRKIERLSEVLPTDDGQQFYIRWLKGPFAGSLHTLSVAFQIFGNTKTLPAAEPITMHFDSYEAAVEGEIEAVNALRLKGYTFA